MRATKFDDGDAELDVAKLYLNGQGTSKSHSKARAHLKRALKSKYITQASWEEADELLKSLKVQPKRHRDFRRNDGIAAAERELRRELHQRKNFVHEYRVQPKTIFKCESRAIQFGN